MHSRAPSTPSSSARAAFTLIELLTVIAIIGILAAIIIPVVGKVRSTARVASSASNLRQLTAMSLVYMAENKDTMPWSVVLAAVPGVAQPGASSTYWHDYLRVSSGKATTNSVFSCPDWVARGGSIVGEHRGYGINIKFPDIRSSTAEAGIGFGTNPTTSSPGNGPIRLSELKSPSRSVMLGSAGRLPDQNTGMGSGNTWNLEIKNGMAYAAWVAAQRCGAERHNGFANYGFFDGHVARLKPDEAWRMIMKSEPL